MNVVIPAAGVGSRFVTAGYTVPKPFLPIKGRPMLDWVIGNISTPEDKVYILMRSCDMHYLQGTPLAYREGVCFIPIDRPTEGAACTVLHARKFIDNDEPLIIANSDQYVYYNRQQWLHCLNNNAIDGWIMTFDSDDPKWSYAKTIETGSDERVVEVAEKRVISPNATVGIYHFYRGSLFVESACKMIEQNLRVRGEFYVCPTFNIITEDRYKDVRIFPVDKMLGLGTPEDFTANQDLVGT